MGKEHDLLHASKAGNVAHIEKILGHKSRKSGIQSFIARTVNSNHQDEMGYTPLHYAALNGHRSAVELLLKFDASTNIPDNSGNYPLHLAAWNGHAEVARILINTGPSVANVNEQNGTEDTALHSASQFGHNQVVAVLLENHTDPCIRNSRNESALDLAAQYGRMETVKLLLSYHPNLLEDLVRPHSPFHLAARNGHMNVVSYLLSCGMSVNTQCDSGTALHEAALYGKVDVVNLLLQCGIDVNAKDVKQQTVMDLLVSHPSARTREIGILIYERSRMSVSSYEHLQGVHAARKSRFTSSLNASFPGNSGRPVSALIKRPIYPGVPDAIVHTAGLRRSGTYDAVPLPRNRHESLKPQLNYDMVPHPQRGEGEGTRDMYSEVKPDSGTPSNVRISPVTGFYELIGPADQQRAALTPGDIHSGYTMLGVPHTVPQSNEPKHQHPATQVHATPSANSDPYGDYSKLRLPVGEPTDPVPSTTSHPTSACVTVSSSHQDQADASSPEGGYNTVVPVPKPRRPSRPKQAVYEIPAGAVTGSAEHVSEGIYGLLGAPVKEVTRPSIRKESSPAKLESTGTSQSYDTVKLESMGTSQSYDTVSLPAKKVSAPSLYDFVPPPTLVQPKSDVEPSFSSDIYEPVASLDRQGEGEGVTKTCPLGGPGYEFVQPRSSVQPQKAGEETLPYARLPGYEPMGPPESKEDEYEILAPWNNPQDEYETIAVVSPRKEPAQTSTSPVYEIAPLPRSIPRPLPEGIRSSAPATVPPPPPKDVSGVVEVPWFEKPQSPHVPVPPRRVTNDYQEVAFVKKSDKQRPDAYEEVRVEFPPEGIDWKRVRQTPPRQSAGEYCTLSEAAKGPPDSLDWRSRTSSETSTSLTEVPFTPPFSPPSPGTAQSALFDAFTAASPCYQTIPEAPEHETDAPPPLTPRKDSLHDENFALSVVESIGCISESSQVEQDPFSESPVASPGTDSVTTSDASHATDLVTTHVASSGTDSVTTPASPKNGFASLHKHFSPDSSKEDLTAETNGHGAEREESVENTQQSDKPSALLYENVLFTRSESFSSTKRTEVQTRDGTEPRPDSYRLSTVSVNSPLDESAEWDKIEAFFSLIGDIEVPKTLDDQIANAGKAETVPGWLRALGLGQYESVMMANGFDELLHLDGVLEEQDLLEIGVADPSHRRIVMEATKALSPAPYISAPDSFKPESMEDWLDLIDLPEYTSVFQHQGYSSMKRIKMLWEVELTSVLEINTLGHRKRMLASLKDSARKPVPMRQERDESLYVDTKISRMKEKLDELKVVCPDARDTAVPSATPGPGNEGSVALMAATEQLAIQERISSSRNKWKHDPSVLINGSVNYTMLYLGSDVVQQIAGVSSTIDACRKMRLSTAKLQKFPSVILSVSVNGIKFIDARSKILVSYHDMTTISYITQDPEDSHVFAYIARDSKTDKHYCHVFKVNDTKLSDEVTMTIGQAFELAFAHFMDVQVQLQSEQRQRTT